MKIFKTVLCNIPINKKKYNINTDIYFLLLYIKIIIQFEILQFLTILFIIYEVSFSDLTLIVVFTKGNETTYEVHHVDLKTWIK